MNFETLRFTVENHIATVAMDRPPVNAVNAQLRQELADLFGTINDLDEVRVVLLTGTGKIFCGGIDLKERAGITKLPGDMARKNREHRNFIDAIKNCVKPVIALLNGPAIGTGLGMAVACDIMVAAEDAYVSMPEVTRGIPTGAATLNRIFGPSKGRRLSYTGGKVSAAELYRLGLVEACCPREELTAEGMKIAEEIARQSPLAVRAAKQCYNLAQDAPFPVAKSLEYVFSAQLAVSEDTQEALAAFAEKREPNYRGR